MNVELELNTIIDASYPYIILLEGPDKLGKTTTALALKAKFEEYGNSVDYVKYPTPKFYDDLVHVNSMYPLDRALLFLIDCSSGWHEMPMGEGDVIILDRHPLFSIGAYIMDNLTKQEKLLVAKAMTSLLPNMFTSNVTFVFEGKRFENDPSYAAKANSPEAIVSHYEAMTHSLKRESNTLADYYKLQHFSELDVDDILGPLKTVDLGRKFTVTQNDITDTINRMLSTIIELEK